MDTRKIQGAMPYYEVTRDGRVLNTERGTEVKPFIGTDGYVIFPLVRESGKKGHFRAHRILYEAYIGPLTRGMQIDHKNGVRTDNRLDNLEAVSCRENIRRSHTLSGKARAGICWHISRHRWCASIYISGKRYYLKESREKAVAEAAYNKALEDWEKYGKLPERKPKPQEGYKHCSRCNSDLPKNRFYYLARTGRYSSLCKECTLAYQKERREKKLAQ